MDWIEKLVTPIIIALISAALPTILLFWLNSKTKSETKKSNKEIRAEIKVLLQEQEKRVRLEEELKSYQQINKLFEEEKGEYKKRTKELENTNGQLKYLLTWYKFDKRDLDLIIDNYW